MRRPIAAQVGVFPYAKKIAPLLHCENSGATVLLTAAHRCQMESDMYAIIDTHTGYTVGTAKTLKSALRAAERRNQQYGAVRFTHRFLG